MRWFDVDGARRYLSGGETDTSGESTVTRKTVYAMVKAGMRVAPRGDSGKRFWFCDRWIDEHLIEKGNAKPATGDDAAPPIARRRA
jgi:hypothetical protein